MKKFSKIVAICLGVFVVSQVAWTVEKVPNRISALDIDVTKVTRIKMAPGLVTVIEFKEPVGEVFVGNDQSIKADISKLKPALLAITLTKSDVDPTNVIVFYSSEKKRTPMIFEIIPSHNTHQDYVKVAGTYGSPEIESTSRILLYSNEEAKPVLEKREKKGVERK